MKKLAVVVFAILWVMASFAQTNIRVETQPSPAEQSVVVARQLIAKNPNNSAAYNALALALCRRARETSDPRFYGEAEAALRKSFDISPNNYDGQRIHVMLLLGRYEFAAALQEASKLNKQIPDDVVVYGFVSDADVELGSYKDAEAACQRMLDLRAGNLPGIIRGARLRQLFGDTEGGLELLNMALQATPPGQSEDSAWILTQMAEMSLDMGKLDTAEKSLQQGLVLFPNYPYALGALAKVRMQQKRYPEAATLLQKRYQASPRAENLYDLAAALQLAARREEAAKDYAEFEQKSVQETDRADNSNRALIFYYADYVNLPGKALEVAQREIAHRHDVFTLDAYAWALYRNGKYSEARKQIETALAVGIRNAGIFDHAGEIALKEGDRTAAEGYLRQAAELDSIGSEEARTILASLQTTPKVGR